MGNRVIHCATHGHGGHGDVDVTKLIVKSCNIGAATMGFKLGPRAASSLYPPLRLRRSKRDLGLSGETAGFVPPPGNWPDITLANVAFGQSVSVTPPQLLAAYCAIANDGVAAPPAPGQAHRGGRRASRQRRSRCRDRA